MTIVEEQFLAVLKAQLTGEKTNMLREDGLTPEEWQEFFRLADIQNVVPLVYEGVYQDPSFQRSGLNQQIKSLVMQLVLKQIRNTGDFQNIYRALSEKDIHPIVVKGIICRNLYPNPDSRPSSDEDLYIPEEEVDATRQAMESLGMSVAPWDKKLVETNYELTYLKKGSSLQIEFHRSLFDNQDPIFRRLNTLFIQTDTIEVEVDKIRYRTFDYTTHMKFLLCHAYKHLVSSGFGLRQICDMVMMGSLHGSEINWELLLTDMKSIHGEQFAAAVFLIGQKYLGFDPDRAQYPDCWRRIQVDETELLKDVLSGGVFGKSDEVRIHSSSITMNAVSSQGGSEFMHILRTVFPKASTLYGRYPWLQKRPYLLPAAWIDRLLKYRRRNADNTESAANSIKLGRKRVEMLKEYGIIK